MNKLIHRLSPHNFFQMNRLTQTVVFLVLFWPLAQLFAQQNPCLCIDTESRPCATAGTRASVKYTKNGTRSINYAIASDPAPAADALANFPGARYKAFWIFGDGNFAYYPHSYPESDALSLSQPYIYRRSGNYKLEALLTEKKSNTKPPARTIRAVEIKSAPPGPGSPFSKQLSGNLKTADILPSDSMRPHNYLTAFAVSAPKDPLLSGIYFFYNSKVDGANVDAEDMHKIVDVDLPDYAGTTYFKGKTASLRNSLGNALYGMYLDYVFVPISKDKISAMPPDADFDEYRIFPILKTTLLDGLPICQFLTVVVGAEPASATSDRISAGKTLDQPTAASGSTGFYTPQKFEELTRLVSTYFDGVGISTPLFVDSTQTSYYVRGMYETRVPMIGSSDPNELEVISICPLAEGKYKVEMRVQVCNRGMLPENTVPVRIIDHTGGEFSDFQFLTDKAKLDTTLRFDATNHTWHFTWHDGLPAVFVPTDARPGEETTEVPYSPKCMEIRFSVIATLSGAQKLVQGTGLESCATFPSAKALGIPDECHFNFGIPAGQFTTGYGFACGEPPVDNCANGLLFYLLVIILLAILAWWFFKKAD